VPKVELHLHLEGAIPQEALVWQLIQKYSGDSSIPDIEALRQKFQFRHFPHFIETWVWKNQFLRDTMISPSCAEAVAQNTGRHNIRYAEMFYTPSDFFRHGLEVQKLTAAIRGGLGRSHRLKRH